MSAQQVASMERRGRPASLRSVMVEAVAVEGAAQAQELRACHDRWERAQVNDVYSGIRRAEHTLRTLPGPTSLADQLAVSVALEELRGAQALLAAWWERDTRENETHEEMAGRFRRLAAFMETGDAS